MMRLNMEEGNWFKCFNKSKRNSKEGVRGKLSTSDNLSAAHKAYSSNFAYSYAIQSESHPFYAYYERPGTRSLMPDMFQKTVLDAGCGAGINTEWLYKQGARVYAVDYSSKMVELTEARLNGNARVLKADLNKSLSQFKSASFDCILSSMVLHYLDNWDTWFAECFRLLKPGGWLVFSTVHPFVKSNKSNHDTNYFEEEWTKGDWAVGPIAIPALRRPLQQIFDQLKANDLTVHQLLEPRPTSECKQFYPSAYEKLKSQPWCLSVKARKVI